VKAFLAACLAAIDLAAISWIILNCVRGRWTGHLPRPPTRGSAIRPDEAQDLSSLHPLMNVHPPTKPNQGTIVGLVWEATRP
jgi:hypothetical protein